MPNLPKHCQFVVQNGHASPHAAAVHMSVPARPSASAVARPALTLGQLLGIRGFVAVLLLLSLITNDLQYLPKYSVGLSVCSSAFALC